MFSEKRHAGTVKCLRPEGGRIHMWDPVYLALLIRT